MDILKLYNIKNHILSLKSLNNGNLAIIDANPTVRIFHGSDYSLIGGLKSSIHYEYLIGTYVDISNDGKYFISAIPKSNKAAVFNLETKEVIAKLGRHKGEIECVKIDPNNRYCATGGQDGKVYIWVLKTSRLIFSNSSHIDYISAITFSDKGEWIATGSYDCTISLLNLSTLHHPTLLYGHKSAVTKICFLSNLQLISADKEGNLIVWDIQKGRIINRLNKINDEVTSMVTCGDKRFIFIGTKLGYVNLYDVEKMELIKHNYIKEHESITSLAFLDNPAQLAIGTAEGNVRVYSVFGNEENYISMIHQRQFKAFYKAIEDNPMLKYSKPYEKVEQIWKKIVKNARLLLEQGNKAKAKAILDLFDGIPKKNAFISQILDEYDKFSLFQKYVNEERYSLAYSLARQYVSFQESELYSAMESKWKKLFLEAQHLILKPKGEEKAQILLAHFRGISEKSILMQQLFSQYRLYAYVDKVISNRDFIKYFELVKTHPFLKELPVYDNLIDYSDKLYFKTLKSYETGDYHFALEACKILTAFPLYNKIAHELMETIHAKRLLCNAIESNNLAHAFSYLSSYPLLYDTPEAQNLESQWHVILDKAQYFAAHGEVQKAMQVFKPYFSIQEKYTSMAHVIAQGYCIQIEKIIHLKEPFKTIENAINYYVKKFGIDENIKFIHELFFRTYSIKIDLEKLEQGSYETWHP